MSNDLIALIASYLYVIVVIGTATFLRTRGTVSPEISRKIIHIGVGTWILPTVLLFRNPWLAMVPPATFIVVNLLSWRYRLVPAMEEGDRNPGTIYFPVAFVLLILLFWPGTLPGSTGGGGDAPAIDPAFPFSRFAVPAGIMAMAWGDAAASLVGRRYGRTRFKVPGKERKSIEGSAAFVLFALAGILLSAIVLLMAAGPDRNPPGLSLGEALAVAGRFQIVHIVIAVLAGAVAEALTPEGLDNLSVPLVVAAVVWFLVLG